LIIAQYIYRHFAHHSESVVASNGGQNSVIVQYQIQSSLDEILPTLPGSLFRDTQVAK